MKLSGRWQVKRKPPAQKRLMGRGRNSAARLTLQHAAPIVEAEIAKRTPSGSGDLRRGIRQKLAWQGNTVALVTYNAEPYASRVEAGRKPGSPPHPGDPALREWAKRRGIPAAALYPIARRIGRRGTKPRRMYAKGGAAAVRKLAREGRLPSVSRFVGRWRQRGP